MRLIQKSAKNVAQTKKRKKEDLSPLSFVTKYYYFFAKRYSYPSPINGLAD